MKKSYFLISSIIIIRFTFSSAVIIEIPGDYPSIQQGIDASSDGDTVLVQPDTCFENIRFNGRRIVLSSLFIITGDSFFIDSTVINGDRLGSVITLDSEENSNAVIEGFTIYNGRAVNGGGIYCFNSQPTIKNNRLVSNRADNDGGGIYCDNANPVINNNLIKSNRAENGGGIYCTSADPIITENIFKLNTSTHGEGSGIACYIDAHPIIYDNTFHNNSANHGGGISCYFSSPLIKNNRIYNNSTLSSGGGIYCFSSGSLIIGNAVYNNSSNYTGGAIDCIYSSPTLSNNTISDNSSVNMGGGIYCWNSTLIIENCIIWDNECPSGNADIYIASGTACISFSDISGGWEGEGNIDINPLFRDPENGDFHLQDSIDCGDPFYSPCIDMGHPDMLDSLLDCNWGLGELRSDIGAYGGSNPEQVGIQDQKIEVPTQFSLSQNHPNPFNVATIIQYNLPAASDVTIDIYDILGRKVKTLIDNEQSAGCHQVLWNANDVSSGIYFYSIQAGDYNETKKMLLLK